MGAPTGAAPPAVTLVTMATSSPFLTLAGTDSPPHTLIPGSLGARKGGLLGTGLPFGEQPPSPATDHTPGHHCPSCVTDHWLTEGWGQWRAPVFIPERLESCTFPQSSSRPVGLSAWSPCAWLSPASGPLHLCSRLVLAGAVPSADCRCPS